VSLACSTCPIGREQDEILSESQEDLRLVIEGVKAMLTEYGFGAKTSSGYGVAEIEGEEVRPEGLGI